jgi:hypothetical protein
MMPPPPGSPPHPSAARLPANNPPRPPPPPFPPPPPPPPPEPAADGPIVTVHRCLPSWKWTRDLLEQIETGSASDADADALLGMVLLVSAATKEALHPPFVNNLILLTYQSIVAFVQYETIAHPRVHVHAALQRMSSR